MTLSEIEVRSPAPGGLEYAARYTHHYQDGRQIVVINSRCENPADRAWAAEQVANMARIQTACEWPVDACLVTRRTTTAWAPEALTEAQRSGLACIICGAEDTESTAMAPAGFRDGAQLFRCAADCTPPAPCGSESCAPTNCGYPVCSEQAEDFDAKLRERLTEAQRKGLACIRCGADDAPMTRVGVLDGGAVWRCTDDCTTSVPTVLDPSRIELLLERCDREDANVPDRRFLYTSEIRWLLGVGPGPDYSELEKLVNGHVAATCTESSMPSTCPGELMDEETSGAVQAQRRDFRDGAWIDTPRNAL